MRVKLTRRRERRGGRWGACGHGTALRLSLAAAPAIRRAENPRGAARPVGGAFARGCLLPPYYPFDQ